MTTCGGPPAIYVGRVAGTRAKIAGGAYAKVAREAAERWSATWIRTARLDPAPGPRVKTMQEVLMRVNAEEAAVTSDPVGP